MCGRFTLTIEASDLQQEFGLEDIPVDWRPRYNIAPSQPVAVISNDQPKTIRMMRWGLIPSWAKDKSIGDRMINARAETLADKPSFKRAFSQQHCLILADGFYEWLREGGKKSAVPYYFHLKTGRTFAFAGLWELWRSETENIYSCTIITCEANSLVAPIHDRMPVILDEKSRLSWLMPGKISEYQGLLKPFLAENMETFPVSPLVNNPANDAPQCLDVIIK